MILKTLRVEFVSGVQKKYSQTEKGKEAIEKARKKYDSKDPEKRRLQKKEYMRRKRQKDPNYCKWK
jgi:DNA-binding PadR family transcriptional regulator